jgi:glutamate transport system permease protein
LNVLIDNFDEILDGFVKTLWLLLFSGAIAAVLGTFLAALRVSPVATMRLAGTSYINIFRNTPLLLILLIILFGAPDLGFTWEPSSYFNYFFVCATIGLGLYTAAFVCEAVRSGINSIPLGQAEAARAIGMTFSQSMTSIILPQAFRAVIPPLTSTYIALAKNTSVALAIGVTEASFVMKKLNNDFASERWPIFFGFACGYILIVAAIAIIGNLLERSVRVS